MNIDDLKIDEFIKSTEEVVEAYKDQIPEPVKVVIKNQSDMIRTLANIVVRQDGEIKVLRKKSFCS